MGAVTGLALLGAWPLAVLASVAQPQLLTAANYAVIGGSTITNTGPTVINGNIALSPGTSITGFTGPPNGTVTGSTDVQNGNNSAEAGQAQTDLATAYNEAANATATESLTGTDLGGLTLTPGVYRFSSSAQLTGTLTLNGEGSTDPTFIFQIGSTLTTASASNVLLENGAGSCAVFWQVGSSATLGTTSAFQGNLMALTSITMNTGATMGAGGGVNGGRALAQNGAVTLDDNLITPPPATCTYVPAAAATPTPSAAPTPSATPTPTPAATPAPAGTTTPKPGGPSTTHSPGTGLSSHRGPFAGPTVPSTGAFASTPIGLPIMLVGIALLVAGTLTMSTVAIRRRRSS